MRDELSLDDDEPLALDDEAGDRPPSRGREGDHKCDVIDLDDLDDDEDPDLEL
jgi:hypothetical protein